MVAANGQAENDVKRREQFITNVSQMIYNGISTLRRRLAQATNSNDCKDINKAAGYPDTISAENYSDMYDREGVAARVVDIYPEESWKDEPVIVETPDTERSVYESAVDELAQKNHLWAYLQRLDKLSGVMRYGVMFIGIDDGLDPKMPAAGLDESGEPTGDAGERKLLYLQVFQESQALVHELEKNPRSPRFNKPKYYKLKYKDPNQDLLGSSNVTSPTVPDMVVHWTRVIHAADNRQSSELFGIPRLQKAYNYLHNLRKLYAGSPEMFWRGAFPGIAIGLGDEAMGTWAPDEEELRERIANYVNGMDRCLYTPGLDVKTLEPNIAKPLEHATMQLQAVCAAISCPLRVFLGSESGERASDEDTKQWRDRLRGRQLDYLNPFLVRPTLERFSALGILPESDGYDIEWPDLHSPTDRDAADIAKARTEALAMYTASKLQSMVAPVDYLTMMFNVSEERAKAIIGAGQEFAKENSWADPAKTAEQQNEPNADGIRKTDEEKVVSSVTGKAPLKSTMRNGNSNA